MLIFISSMVKNDQNVVTLKRFLFTALKNSVTQQENMLTLLFLRLKESKSNAKQQQSNAKHKQSNIKQEYRYRKE